MNKPNMTRGVMIMVSFIFVAISVAIVVMFARLNDRVNDLEDQLKVESNTRNSSHDTLASQLAKLVTSGELLNAKVDNNNATDEAQSFRIQQNEESDDLINEKLDGHGQDIIDNATSISNNARGVSDNADTNAQIALDIDANTAAIADAVAPPQFESRSTADILEGNYAEVPFHEGSFSDPEEVVSFDIISSTLEQNNVTGVLADGVLQLFASEPLVRDETFSVTVDASDANGNVSDPFTVEFHVRPVPVFDPAEQSVAIPQGTEPGYDLVFAQCDVPFDQVTYSISQSYGEHQGLFQVTQPDSDSAPVIVTTQNTLDIATANVYSFYLDANTEFDAVGRFRVNVDTLTPVFISSDSVDIFQTHDLSGKIYTAIFDESVEVSEISIHSSTRADITVSTGSRFELYASDPFYPDEEFQVEIVATGVNGNASGPFMVNFSVTPLPVFDPYSSTTAIPLNTEAGYVIEYQQSNLPYAEVAYSMSMLEEGVDDYFQLTQPTSETDKVKVETLKTLSDSSNTKYSFRMIATANESGTQGVFDATIDTRTPIFNSSQSESLPETHAISSPIYTATFTSSPEDVTGFAVQSTTSTKNITASSTEGIFELFVDEAPNRDETFEVVLVATDANSGNTSEPFSVVFTVRAVPKFDPVSTTLDIPFETEVGYPIELAQSDVRFDEVEYSLQKTDSSNTADPNEYYSVTQPDSESAFVVVTTKSTLERSNSNSNRYEFRLVATTNFGDWGGFDVFVNSD